MIHSSETVPSSASSSLSLPTSSDSPSPKKGERRLKLVNTSMKKSNTLFLYVNMHGTIYLKDKKTLKCNTRNNPFDVLLRYIISAPGETTLVSDDIMYFLQAYDNDYSKFDDMSLTPNDVVGVLKLGKHDEDLSPLVITNFQKNQAVGLLNFGFEKRNQTLINYKESPYCLKQYETDSKKIVYSTDIFNFGIYCLNTVKNGWTAPTNILFDIPFINWVKSNYSSRTNSSYEVKKLDQMEYLSHLTNDILFDYICNELKIKRLFFIDDSCDIDENYLPSRVPINFSVKDRRDIFLKNVNAQLDNIYKEMFQIIKLTGINTSGINESNIYAVYLQNTKFTPSERKRIEELKTTQNELEEMKRHFEGSNSDLFKEIDAAKEDISNYIDPMEVKIENAEMEIDELFDEIGDIVQLRLSPLEHTLVAYKNFIRKYPKKFQSKQQQIDQIISQTETFLQKGTLNEKDAEKADKNFYKIMDLIERKFPTYKTKYPDIVLQYKERFSKDEIKKVKKLLEEIKTKKEHLQVLKETPEPSQLEKRQTIRQKRKSYYDKVKIFYPNLRRTKKYQANAKQNKGNWGVVKASSKRTR